MRDDDDAKRKAAPEEKPDFSAWGVPVDKPQDIASVPWPPESDWPATIH